MVGVFLSLCIIYYKCLWHFMVNFFRGEKTLKWPNDELMMFDWGLLLFFSNHFFQLKARGGKNSVIVRVLICGDALVFVKLERERKRDTEDFRSERVRERLRGCELVSKWYDIFFLSIVKCKHIRWGSDISYNTSTPVHVATMYQQKQTSHRRPEIEKVFLFLFSLLYVPIHEPDYKGSF